MKNGTLRLLVACAFAGLTPAAMPAVNGAACDGINTLSAAEKADGWQLLFDGKSTAGWHGYNGRAIDAWTIDDCALKTVGTQGNYGADTRPDLVTDQQFTNFELTLDWKATTGGNSGLIYGIVEDKKYDTAWKTGPEYQLMDDAGFKEKVDANQKAAANYAMQPPDESKKVLKPVGEWNTTRLVVNGPHVEHWLNGQKVLEFERWTPEWTTLRDAGKWKSEPDYGKAKTGRIALQDHGSVFWFRNIKLRPLE
jgi:hypothetical protein